MNLTDTQILALLERTCDELRFERRYRGDFYQLTYRSQEEEGYVGYAQGETIRQAVSSMTEQERLLAEDKKLEQLHAWLAQQSERFAWRHNLQSLQDQLNKVNS